MERAAQVETPDGRRQAPSPSVAQVSEYRSNDLAGFLYLLGAVALISLALLLAASRSTAAWLAGQLLLGISLLQWFCLLHEAGHKTLFRTQWLNQLTGHAAGFLTGFPFHSWKLVHGMHHRWTGWQDLDVTTAALVPRERSRVLCGLVNVCWRFWIPVFSLVYRLDNYWNVRRLRRLTAGRRNAFAILVNVVLLLAGYVLLIVLVGPATILRQTGPGVILSFLMQEMLILSQHTHIPMKLSGGLKVDPFPPLQQEPFTRSLRFPVWFSRLILLNLDAHELHHMYPQVPGYWLDRVPSTTRHPVTWWKWLRHSKSISGEVFLFQNRNQSGFNL